MNKLVIENNKELMTEYGRAFAWINFVEFYLEHAISTIGKLNLIDKNLKERLLSGKTLGQKIEIAKSILDPKLIEKLSSFNKKRNLLVHSVVSQEFSFKEGKPHLGKHVIGIGDKIQHLDVQFLQSFIDSAQQIQSEISGLFNNEEIKPLNFEEFEDQIKSETPQ